MKTFSHSLVPGVQSRPSSASLRRLALRRAGSALAVSALFAFGAAAAQAAPYQYTGGTGGTGTAAAPVTGVFSNGFSPTIANGTTSVTTTADTLSFGGAAGAASYTATDDLTSTINANALSFSNIAAIVATLARSNAANANNSITLGTTGTTAPTVTSGAGAVVNGLDLILANNTTFNIGGSFTQTGAVSGASSLTKTGSGGLILSGDNTYTGGTLLNSSGGFGIGSDTALGTGTFTWGTAGAGQNIFISAVNGDRTIANNVVFNGNRLVVDSSSYGSGLTVGNLTINGTFAFNGTSPSDIFLRKNLTLNGVVSGSNNNLGITLNGDAGVLALTNAGNTFSGGIKFQNASIVLASSEGALGAATNALSFIAGGNGTLRAGASFNSARNASAVAGVTGTFDTNSFNLDWSGILSGAGGYTKAGTGTLTLSGANTYTGATTITAGTLMLGAAGATATGTSGSLGAFSGSIVVNGGILDLAGFSDATDALSGTAGKILNSATGTTSTLTVGSNNGGGTFAGTIADNGGTGGTVALTKIGTGTETLSGANTYTGGTTVSAGTLALASSGGANGAIPTGSTVNVLTGAALNLNDTSSSNGAVINFNNFTLNLNGGTSLTFGNQNLGTFNLPGNINLTGTNTISTGNIREKLALSGVVSGPGDLIFSGGGAQNSHFLVLSGADTYTGSTKVTSGGGGATIQLSGGADRLPVGTTLTLNASSTNPAQLDLNGQNQTIAGLLSTGTPSNDAVVNSSATLGTLTINNSATDNFGGILGAPAQTLNNATVAGTNFALNKTGAGTLVLTGVSGFTGGTTINGGAINISSTGVLGTGGITVANGTLQTQDRVSALNIANNLTLSGPQALNFFNSAGFNLTGTVALAGDTGIRTDPAFQAGNIGFTNVISGTGNLTFYSENGNGTTAGQRFVLSGANTYAGNTTITSGTAVTTGTPFTVQLSGGDNRLPTGTTLTFGGEPAGGAGTHNANANLELNGINQTIAGLTTANGATGTYRVIGSSATPSSLTINDTSNYTFSGSVGGAGTNNNNLALVKTGTGTQTLSGANTYSGGTTVSNGTLNAANDAALGTGSLTFTPAAGSAATVTFTSANPSVSSITGTTAGTSSIVLGNATAGTPTILTFGSDSTNQTYNGTISDASTAATGKLTKVGTGTQTLSNATANTYSGGTTVSSGTLTGNAGSYGSGAVAVASGATVDYTQGRGSQGTATNTISGGGTATFGGGSSGGGTVNYTGNDSAAQTNVKSGTLTLNNAAGPALSGPVAVATGATVQLNANNQVATAAPPATAPTSAAVMLGGGTFNAGGHSDGSISGADPTTSAVTSSMGALTLINGTASVFDFGLGSTNGIVAFADSSSTLGTGTLNILNYTGATDALYIGTSNVQGSGGLTPTQLKQISFNGLDAIQLSNGQLAAAPEPSAWAAFGVGLLGLGGLAVRARRRAAAA